MKLRTLLIVTSVALIAFALAIGGYIVSVARRTDAIARQSALTEQLIREFFEQSTLAQEYAAHHEERPKTQWYLEQERIATTLASADLRQEPSAGRVGAILSGAQDLKNAFDALVREVEAPSPDPALEDQLASDLLVKSRAVTRMADGLSAETFKERIDLRAEANRNTFILLGALILLMLIMRAYLYRRIAGPLLELQAGTKIVAGGNLGHRINGTATDELGELSRAFDAMTAKLQASYDTLERKVEERTAELHVMSRRNETLLKSIGDGVIAIDRDWTITLWNPATVRLTGWSEEEALGKPFRDRVRFIREHDRKENLAFIEEAMLYGETRPMSNSTLLLTRDGREVPVGDSAAPIFDEAGKVTGIIIVFRDMTQEKEASMLHSDFAYASHQLRTPINKALWAIEAAEDQAAGTEAEGLMKEAQKSVKDVEKLAERLLVVSEIDQGRKAPDFKEVQLSSFMKDLSADVRSQAVERGVKFVWPKPPAEAKTDADPKMLAVAVEELLRNAVMYSQKGGRVEVELQLDSLELVLRVRDHGIGISDEQKPLIFTKFFRGQNVPADAVGAGLGLFIARSYARLMGGKLWFESELGKGTTFTLSLPRVRGMRQ